MKLMTIPLVGINQALAKYGAFEPETIASVINTLVIYWRVNDYNESLTRELVLHDLELDPLVAQVLWNEIGQMLITIAYQIRSVALSHQLIAWRVQPYNILLELEDDTSCKESLGQDPAAY